MLTRAVGTALLALAAAWGNAQDWGNVAVISDTMGNNSGRLCVGDGSRPSDIGCPTYAPSLSTAGHVSITGNVSANKFIGDGSSLTGMASGDRLTSGTHVVVVNESTGSVSLTTGGSTWGYLSAGWSFLNNLFTNTVSSSLVSATNVSATLVDATRDGTVSGTYGYFRYISGTNIHGTFTGDGSGLTGIASGDRIASGTTPQTQMVAISNTRYISVTQGGANTAWFDPTRGLVALGVSTTGPISGTRGYFSNYVGIGTGTPAAHLTIEENGPTTAAAILVSNTVSGTAASARLQLSTQGGSAYIYRTSEGYTPAGVRNSLVIQEFGGGDIVFWTYGGEVARITSGRNFGIGEDSPTATLGVSGTISATGAIQVGASALSCSGGIPGALRYKSGSMEYCNGTSWTNLSSSTSAGVTTIASLTDVQLTNTAGRDYLRYDAIGGKWVNISESEVMSTTTMLSNWPDAIVCTSSSTSRTLYLDEVGTTYATYEQPRSAAGGTRSYISFNAAGAYNSNQSQGSSDCVTNAWSISQLYARGLAFNFIGGIDGDAGSPVEGDRLVSGTLSVVANSGTSIVSLTTNGTTWGYLGNAASFLPTIMSGKVSATNISASTIQAIGEVISDIGGPGGNFIASGTSSVSASSNGRINFAVAGDQRLAVTGNGLEVAGYISLTNNIHMTSGAPAIYMDDLAPDGYGMKRITANDGSGNFNVRAGGYFDGSLKYAKTGDGYAGMTFTTEGADGQIALSVTPAGTVGNTVSSMKYLILNSNGELLLNGVVKAAGSVPITNNSYNLGSAALRWGCLYYNNSSLGTCASDARLKDKIADLSFGNALDKIAGLRIRSFVYREAPTLETHGLVAQEVMKVAPELVVKDPSTSMYKVNYSDIQWLAVEALQQLNKKLDSELRAANDNVQILRSEIDDLRRELREHGQANKK